MQNRHRHSQNRENSQKSKNREKRENDNKRDGVFTVFNIYLILQSQSIDNNKCNKLNVPNSLSFQNVLGIPLRPQRLSINFYNNNERGEMQLM